MCAQTREKASIHRTRAGDGSSGLVCTSSVGRPLPPAVVLVEPAVVTAASVAVDVGACSTIAGISTAAPRSFAAAAGSAATENAPAAGAGGGLQYTAQER